MRNASPPTTPSSPFLNQELSSTIYWIRSAEHCRMRGTASRFCSQVISTVVWMKKLLHRERQLLWIRSQVTTSLSAQIRTCQLTKPTLEALEPNPVEPEALPSTFSHSGGPGQAIEFKGYPQPGSNLLGLRKHSFLFSLLLALKVVDPRAVC